MLPEVTRINPFLPPSLILQTPTSLRNAGLEDISANGHLYLLFLCYCLWKTNNVPRFPEVVMRRGKWRCELLNALRIKEKKDEEINHSVLNACLGGYAVKKVWDQNTDRGQFKETLNNYIRAIQFKFQVCNFTSLIFASEPTIVPFLTSTSNWS